MVTISTVVVRVTGPFSQRRTLSRLASGTYAEFRAIGTSIALWQDFAAAFYDPELTLSTSGRSLDATEPLVLDDQLIGQPVSLLPSQLEQRRSPARHRVLLRLLFGGYSGVDRGDLDGSCPLCLDRCRWHGTVAGPGSRSLPPFLMPRRRPKACSNRTLRLCSRRSAIVAGRGRRRRIARAKLSANVRPYRRTVPDETVMPRSAGSR